MTSIETLLAQLPGLRIQDLERWILNAWVRPERDAGRYSFHEIDVARVRLICELRDEMNINEDALPVVLSLLDQLYDTRRRMKELIEALRKVAPEEVLQILADQLANTRPEA